MAHYTVRRGESLSAIAQRVGTSWQELARLNNLKDPDRLRVGQRLVVPGGPSQPPAHPAAARRTAPSAAPNLLESAVQEARDAWRGLRSTIEQWTTARTVPAPTPAPRTTRPERAIAVAGDVTEAQLRAIMPTAGTRAAMFVGPLNQAMRAHGINTNERRAAFLAQISVESGDLRRTEENLNYSVERLQVVWPSRFPNAAAARPYARNPEALANRVYSNRLGNGDAESGDGWRYRGRGLMQTTGRDNYRSAGFEHNPDALADATTAADSAGRFWSTNGLNARTVEVLNRSQFNGVSRTVNGGDHGSAERWAAYQRALRALQPAER